MTMILIEFAWFIGCSIVLGLLLVCLIILMSIAHYDVQSEKFLGGFSQTFFITISLMLILIPHNDVVMNIFLHVYNFLRMCFGDNMRTIGRLQEYLQDAGSRTGSLFFPFFLLVFIFCFIRYIITAPRGERMTAFTFLPAIILVELTILMCIADRIITLFLGMLFFGSIFMSAKGYNVSQKVSNKGFAKSYTSPSYPYSFHLVSENPFNINENQAILEDNITGKQVWVRKYESGTVRDDDGNVFYE